MKCRREIICKKEGIGILKSEKCEGIRVRLTGYGLYKKELRHFQPTSAVASSSG